MKGLSAKRESCGKEEPYDWTLCYKGFHPSEEGLREALCTLANGYFGTRGAASEARASDINYPGTYVAGIYDTLATNISGRKIYNEDLVNCPDWTYITFRLKGGGWISPSENNVRSYRQQLDMRRGVLSRRMTVVDDKGRRIDVTAERMVHMKHRNIGAIRYEICPEDYEGPVYIRSGLDGSVENTGVARYRALRSRHLVPVKSGLDRGDGVYLLMRTVRSRIKISEAARTRVFRNGKKYGAAVIRNKRTAGTIYQDIKVDLGRGDTCRIDKTVAIYTSKDRGVRDPLRAALRKIRTVPGFDALMEQQAAAWKDIWEKCGYTVNAEKPVGKIINFHAFHLLQTATGHNGDIDAGLPARGLHGEAYRGHIFWDELFVMPLYDYQTPKVSEALLMYRYRRLAQARRYARENGYKGAMFPWQSGSTGDEETQIVHLNPLSGKWGPDYSRNQRHISFAIAHNIWEHWKRTLDDRFMDRYGAEMFLSIANFCASLASFSPDDGRYHTHGLMGPDEFHEKMPGAEHAGYTDNAYSNVMIVWILRRALELLAGMTAKKRHLLMERSGVTSSDSRRWEDITRRMNILVDDSGIIEQFDGYFGLKELDMSRYRKKYGDIHRLDRILKAEGKSPNAYKINKQADVLMMFYMLNMEEVGDIFEDLGYSFSKNMLGKNYDYYISRTSHGSTLSKVVHCYLAYILGRKREAWKWYIDVLDSDIHDVQGGTTPEGIHTGVMGGSIDILMRAFAGMDVKKDALEIDPVLPGAVESMKFSIKRGRYRVFMDMDKKRLSVKVSRDDRSRGGMKVSIRGKERRLVPGREYKFRLK